MKKITLSIFTFLFSLVASAVSIPTGNSVSDFSLSASDGKTYNLSQFKGKTVVLEWHNKDCPYVKKHYDTSNMQALQKKYTSQGVVWLSIISSAPNKQGHLSAAEAKNFFSAAKASPTAVLFDPTGSVGKSFDAKTTPHMFIINPEGRLVYQGAIDSDSSAKPDSVKTATPIFANSLDLVLAGKTIDPKIATNEPYGCSVKY